MTQKHFEELKRKQEDGTANDEDNRLIKQYEQEGYECRPGKTSERSPEPTKTSNAGSEKSPSSSAPSTSTPSKTGPAKGSATVSSAERSSTSKADQS